MPASVLAQPRDASIIARKMLKRGDVAEAYWYLADEAPSVVPAQAPQRLHGCDEPGLRASEAQYRQLLARANTIDEIIRVSAKVDEVRNQVEVTQGRFNVLEDLNQLATVNVNFALPPAANAPKSGLPTPVEVLFEAARASYVAAWLALNTIIVVLVASAWLVPLTVFGLLIWRTGRRLLPGLKARWLA